jgi:hypothetical protein
VNHFVDWEFGAGGGEKRIGEHVYAIDLEDGGGGANVSDVQGWRHCDSKVRALEFVDVWSISSFFYEYVYLGRLGFIYRGQRT